MSKPSREKIIAEARAAADFADGLKNGQLVPLADFTRQRIAKALRDTATELENDYDVRVTDGALAIIGTIVLAVVGVICLTILGVNGVFS
jgi:hypothetical protein